MEDNGSAHPAILHDPQQRIFKVNRNNFVSAEILDGERARIFDHCWLYLGHSSELAEPGAFLTRNVGGRSILFTRDAKGQLRALLNTCPHRGSQVCREKKGKAKSFQCFYHGWVFGSDGKLRSQPGEESYPADFKSRESSNMQAVPRFEEYRGLCFVCFDADAETLVEYLGAAKEYVDVIMDQTEAMSILPGTHEYSIRANWKLLVENSIDGYHALTTHASYFDYLMGTAGNFIIPAVPGVGHDLGKGHAVVEYAAPWGRPIASWIPAWGEAGRAEMEAIEQKLAKKFGAERAERITKKNRNLLIFPNLIINDIMALTVRTFYPTAPDYMTINAWALAPTEESAWARKYRLYNFLEFLGPGGFATPDDAEALEHCQRGFANAKEAPWNDISKGMGQAVCATNDEEQMRGFWQQWNERMFPQPARPKAVLKASGGKR